MTFSRRATNIGIFYILCTYISTNISESVGESNLARVAYKSAREGEKT